MADRNFDFVKALGKGRTIVCGSFLPNGAGSPVADPAWLGFTVTWVSTGLWTITLTDSYAAIVSAHATIAMNAATDVVPQWGAIDVVTNKTLALRSLAVAAVTDIAANANNRVHFTLILRNTSVTP